MVGDAPGLAPCGLDEEISAMMLRFARERFNARRAEGEEEQEGEGGDEVDTDGDRVMKTIESPSNPNSPRLRPQDQDYEPIPTADDETSYAILQPASRRILAKLDATLAILHNARVAAMPTKGSARDSEGDDDDINDDANGEADTAAESAFETELETGPESEAESQPGHHPEPKTKNTARRKRGRPVNPDKKYWWENCTEVPLPGETWREMFIRIAKKTKRRMPVFDDPDDPDKPGPGPTYLPPRTARTKSESAGKSRSRSTSTSRSKSRSISRSPSPWFQSQYSRTLARKLRPRSWRDVLGAAALAGFPPSVLARATQRCANLFDEDMRLVTLPERAHYDEPELKTTRYIPGMAPPESSDDEDDQKNEELEQKRSLSRHSSVRSISLSPGVGARSGSELMSEDGVYMCPHTTCTRAQTGFSVKQYLMKHLESVHAGQGMAGVKASLKAMEKARKASLKGKTAKTVKKEPLKGELVHFCPHATCERALRGFPRRQNLLRHVEKMHGGEGSELVRATTPGRASVSREGTEEVEEEGKRKMKRSVREMDLGSEDEMEGAVHVDGFLKPIKMRPGWRATDLGNRTRMKKGERKIKREENEEGF